LYNVKLVWQPMIDYIQLDTTHSAIRAILHSIYIESIMRSSAYHTHSLHCHWPVD